MGNTSYRFSQGTALAIKLYMEKTSTSHGWRLSRITMEDPQNIPPSKHCDDAQIRVVWVYATSNDNENTVKHMRIVLWREWLEVDSDEGYGSGGCGWDQNWSVDSWMICKANPSAW